MTITRQDPTRRTVAPVAEWGWHQPTNKRAGRVSKYIRRSLGPIKGWTRALEDRHLPEWVAAITVVSTTLFGAVLLIGSPAFDSPAYALVRQWADLRTWGLVLLILAAFHLIMRAFARESAWVPTSLILLVVAVWDVLVIRAQWSSGVTPVIPGWSFTISMLCALLLLHRAFSPAWHHPHHPSRA